MTNPYLGQVSADYSANAPTIPISGYVLVTTVPAQANRVNIEVANMSSGPIQLVLDDGYGTTATISTFVLSSGGSTQPVQGGIWSSTSFKGRVQVYAPSSTAFVTARQE